MDIQTQKTEIRAEIRAKTKELSPAVREIKSRTICSKLKKLSIYQRSKKIMFYVSTSDEVETIGLIHEALNAQKTVIVPRLDKEEQNLKPCVIRDLDQDLAEGSYRILEPKLERVQLIELSEIELVIVPGLAFDHLKNRLGRGKGYYDRFLAKLPRKTQTIGLAFDFQMVEKVPVTELDVPLRRVIYG